MDYRSGGRVYRHPAVPNLSQRGWDYQHTQEPATASPGDYLKAFLLLTVLLCLAAFAIGWL